MAAFLTILMVSSFAHLLSLVFRNPYNAGIFTIWIRRITRIAQFFWLSIAVLTVKEDSRNKMCRADKKTNNLLLLILVCAIICATLVVIDFV